ncbi:MAG: glycosyl hydrolase [Chitinophagaceae bacterium]
MKQILLVLSFFFVSVSLLRAQVFVTSVEAEGGALTGVNIASDPSSSGGQYVTGFDNAGDKVTVTVNVPKSSYYNLTIRYRSTFGDKTQDLYANEAFAGNIVFKSSGTFTDLNAGTVSLNAGNNTISIQKNWGYIDVDKFSIYTVPPNVFNIAATLIDAQATTEVKGLYNYLLSKFGHYIISGSTVDYYNNVKQIVNKSPLLSAWDFASYSPMYPYKWENGGHVFGAVDNNDAENAINWYNSTGRKGIVALHWHWSSPSGGTAGTNTFYTNQTTFDVSKAVIPGTQENTYILRDIDAIAVQLKKLSDAGVPVLWRPLHEAGGAWFWWGAKGSGSAKALWDIMYDRLHNYFGLHNLIWVWSTPEADWYPGNEKVDIIGYDSYPGAYNYTPQKNMFDHLYNVTSGKKLIAMSENGPVPDVGNVFSSEAAWSWFMTWNDLASAQNSNQHLIDAYSNPSVITLENYESTLPVSLTSFTARIQGKKIAIDWTTTKEVNSDHFEIKRSSNGADFYSMATITAKRHSTIDNSYTVFDNNPSAGTNYYQLIQYDIDGKAVNYGIRTINTNSLSMFSVKIYPNPVNENTGILLTNIRDKKITVNLVDLLGKVIMQKEITTSNGQGYYKLDMGAKPAAGNYILHVQGNGGLRESLKVFVR